MTRQPARSGKLYPKRRMQIGESRIGKILIVAAASCRITSVSLRCFDNQACGRLSCAAFVPDCGAVFRMRTREWHSCGKRLEAAVDAASCRIASVSLRYFENQACGRLGRAQVRCRAAGPCCGCGRVSSLFAESGWKPLLQGPTARVGPSNHTSVRLRPTYDRAHPRLPAWTGRKSALCACRPLRRKTRER